MSVEVAVERKCKPDRRTQILDAAENCFCTSGFHAASMAQIAAVAGISVGHIYRYFDNKEEIVVAISSRDLENAGRELIALEPHSENALESLITHILAAAKRTAAAGRFAMTLEIRAEAARNPRIAEQLRRANADCRAAVADLVRPYCEGCPEDELETRVDLVIAISEGLMLRLFAEPERDWTNLTEEAKDAIRRALRPST